MGRAGLIMINAIFRHVFRQNTTAPCPTHYTSQVIDGDKIRIPEGPEGESVRRSFAQSGNCYIQGKNGIKICSGVKFAPGVKIISAARVRDPEKPLDEWEYRSWDGIWIGHDCLIGANAVILPGVDLGNYVIVGAGSVVTRCFPDNVTIAGNPAKVIG